MTKYIKKPVIVDATQWFMNGDHPQDDCFRAFDDTGKRPDVAREGNVVRYYRHPRMDGQHVCAKCNTKMHDHGWIDTLEGGHIVCVGDYIITGIEGEYYPCKSGIFHKTYAKVD